MASPYTDANDGISIHMQMVNNPNNPTNLLMKLGPIS